MKLMALPFSLVFVLAILAARPDEPKPLAPLNLAMNTAADEDDPCLASSNLTLYYAVNTKGKFDIMVSTRTRTDAKWDAGRC